MMRLAIFQEKPLRICYGIRGGLTMEDFGSFYSDGGRDISGIIRIFDQSPGTPDTPAHSEGFSVPGACLPGAVAKPQER